MKGTKKSDYCFNLGGLFGFRLFLVLLILILSTFPLSFNFQYTEVPIKMNNDQMGIEMIIAGSHYRSLIFVFVVFVNLEGFDFRILFQKFWIVLEEKLYLSVGVKSNDVLWSDQQLGYDSWALGIYFDVIAAGLAVEIIRVQPQRFTIRYV